MQTFVVMDMQVFAMLDREFSSFDDANAYASQLNTATNTDRFVAIELQK